MKKCKWCEKEIKDNGGSGGNGWGCSAILLNDQEAECKDCLEMRKIIEKDIITAHKITRAIILQGVS